MKTKKVAIMNPQKMTPQREMLISLYNNPESETFGNAKQSAIRAGFSEAYANNITVQAPRWFVDNCTHGELMQLAQEKLKHYLTLDAKDTPTMKIQQDTAKFIASSLGKEKYSTRSEVRSTGEKRAIDPTTKLIVEKVLDDFMRPKETRLRIEQTL